MREDTKTPLKRRKPLKGRFVPKNPSKYKGDPTRIIFRSSWELRVMKMLDERDDILQWSSEELAVWYKVPHARKAHRYFPDFVVKMKTRDGLIKTFMIEVKPYAQTQPPKVQKKKTQKYMREVLRWGVNKSKWEAARKYCKKNNMTFEFITEKTIGSF